MAFSYHLHHLCCLSPPPPHCPFLTFAPALLVTRLFRPVVFHFHNQCGPQLGSEGELGTHTHCFICLYYFTLLHPAPWWLLFFVSGRRCRHHRRLYMSAHLPPPCRFLAMISPIPQLPPAFPLLLLLSPIVYRSLRTRCGRTWCSSGRGSVRT